MEDIKSSPTICQSPLTGSFHLVLLFHLHFLSQLRCDPRTRRHREAARHDTPADSPPLDRLVSLNATLPPSLPPSPVLLTGKSRGTRREIDRSGRASTTSEKRRGGGGRGRLQYATVRWGERKKKAAKKDMKGYRLSIRREEEREKVVGNRRVAMI